MLMIPSLTKSLPFLNNLLMQLLKYFLSLRWQILLMDCLITLVSSLQYQKSSCKVSHAFLTFASCMPEHSNMVPYSFRLSRSTFSKCLSMSKLFTPSISWIWSGLRTCCSSIIVPKSSKSSQIYCRSNESIESSSTYQLQALFRDPLLFVGCLWRTTAILNWCQND